MNTKSLLLIALSLGALCLASCEDKEMKENLMPPTSDCVYPIADGNKTGSTYQLTTHLGHSAATCNGCLYINGKWLHKSCMGSGNLCAASALVSVELQSDSSYNAIVVDTEDLTNEDFFMMPARSLCVIAAYGGKTTYLNIPEQLVYRDTTTLQFTFTGLFFSNYPDFEND